MLLEKYRNLAGYSSKNGVGCGRFFRRGGQHVLLKVAIDTLGYDNVLAVTADSETYPSSELKRSHYAIKMDWCQPSCHSNFGVGHSWI